MNTALHELRRIMADREIDAVLVPASDYHHSEYYCDYFKSTEYLSHFTGESCTLVITADEACLWTDGRFFVQAEEQMTSEFTLMPMGVEGVPTVSEYLSRKLPDKGCLGFDGRLITVREMEDYHKKLDPKGIRFAWQEDLVGMIWTDRPAVDAHPAFFLEPKYAGRSMDEKLEELRRDMGSAGADTHILTALEDIAWLFNIRGNDISCTPVVLAYAVITPDHTELFVYDGAVDAAMAEEFRAHNVTLRPYDSICRYLAELPGGSRILADPKKVTTALIESLPADCTVLYGPNPTTARKAIKNEVEIANTIRAHVKDGVAVTRFMYWLKKNVGRIPMTEISAAEVLEGYRREQELFHELSFDTIAGYGPHGAMMHYMATPETDAELKPEGFLLVDSGGHYLDGTTDITRTFILGPVTDLQKRHFTAVVRGMLNLANARFLFGCSGETLDYLAREPMWEMGIDYRCGTGHGVGHILSVHEGPQGIRWKLRPGDTPVALAPGMIVTDEPGIYLDYQYGIRIENELLVVSDEKNEYGQFLKFRTLTCCPIDLDGIDTRYMSPREIRRLNDYHEMVYTTLKDHLDPEVRDWLRTVTRPV